MENLLKQANKIVYEFACIAPLYNALTMPHTSYESIAASKELMQMADDASRLFDEIKACLSAQQAVAADRATSDEIDTSAGGG